MPTLRKQATGDQAAELVGRLRTAESELRAALVGTRGLRLPRAGQLVKMVRQLQVIRLEIECESIP